MTCKRKAITPVITVIIILVASIVLGISAVAFGTSIFQTESLRTSIAVQGIRTWVNDTSSQGIAWGAAAIANDGDKIISVDTIQIRGADISYFNWYVDSNQTRVTQNFQKQFNYTKNDQNGFLKGSEATGGIVTPGVSCIQGSSTIVIDEDGAGPSLPLCLKQASGPVSLAPGTQMIVYYHVPNGIMNPADAGQLNVINIYAGNAGAQVSIRTNNP